MTRSLTSRSFCVPKKGFATQHGDFLKKVADWVKHKKEEAKEAAAVQAELRGGLIPGPDKKRLLQGKLEVGLKNAEQEKVVHRSVADFFFSQKIAFAAIDSQEFRVMTQELQTLGKMDAECRVKLSWSPHSAVTLATTDLDAAYGSCQSELNADMLADSANHALTVTSDGWRDLTKNSVQNFLVNSPGGSYYVKSTVFQSTKNIDLINTWLDTTN